MKKEIIVKQTDVVKVYDNEEIENKRYYTYEELLKINAIFNATPRKNEEK